jgi:hypothetical protein
MPDMHGRRENRAAVLEEKGDIRRQRAGQSEGDSDDHADFRKPLPPHLLAEDLAMTALGRL